jgi:hypothetical protein
LRRGCHVQLGGTLSGFGDSIRAHRMRAKHFGNIELAAAGETAHGLEERRHAVRIETRPRQQAQTDSVRFGFVGACEADLLLDGQALRRRDAGHGCIATACRCAD